MFDSQFCICCIYADHVASIEIEHPKTESSIFEIDMLDTSSAGWIMLKFLGLGVRASI